MDASSLQIFTACGLSHLLSVSGSHVALLLGLYVLAASTPRSPRPGQKPRLGAPFSVLLRHPLWASGICLPSSAPWQRRLAGGAVGAPGKRTVFSWLFGPFAAGHPSLLDLGYWLCPLFCGSGRTDALKGEGGTGACIFFRAGPWDGPFCSPRGHIFSLPLLVHHFHAVSLLSLPANLLLVPLLSLSLVLAVSAVFGGLVLPSLGRVLFVMAGSLVSLSLELGRLLSESRPFMVTTGPLGFGALFCYGLLLSLLLGDFPQGSRLARYRKIWPCRRFLPCRLCLSA